MVSAFADTICLFCDNADRVRGNALKPTREAELLLGSCLYVNTVVRDAEYFGDIAFHLLNIGGKLGLLSDDCRIDIYNVIALLGKESVYFFCKKHAVDILVRTVGIREMLSYVTEPESADDRIHYRMNEHVGIRMPEKTHFIGNLDTAEDKVSALAVAVNVVAVTYSDVVKLHHLLSLSRNLSIASAMAKSYGVVIFMFCDVQSTGITAKPSASQREASSVTVLLFLTAEKAAARYISVLKT